MSTDRLLSTLILLMFTLLYLLSRYPLIRSKDKLFEKDQCFSIYSLAALI